MDLAEAYEELALEVRSDPVWYVETFLDSHPWTVQAQILEAIRDYKRIVVRSCHGIGKSWLAAQVILWFLIAFYPSIVLSTAPTFRQVEKLVWKEVRASFNRASFKIGHLLPKAPELQIQQDQWYGVGLSTNDPNRFQGFHEENILVVIDEGPGVDEDIHEAVNGVMTSKNAKLFMTGNPTATTGTFFNAFNSDLWKTFHVAAWDTPNFTEYGIVEADIASGAWKDKLGDKPLVNPNLITPGWAAEMYQLWGPDSSAYQVRVGGNFPKKGLDTIIPYDYVERAIERYADLEDQGVLDDLDGLEPRTLGVDVARFGDDDSVLAPRIGNIILPLEYYNGLDTMELTGKIVQIMDRLSLDHVNVDEPGLGGGVEDRLRELDYDVTGVNTGNSPKDPTKYFNLRAELWATFRDKIHPNPRINANPYALPEDDRLRADLCAPKYKNLSDGRIQLERKEDTKKRLRRSPDAGDAVILASANSEDIDNDGAVVDFDVMEQESRWKGSGRRKGKGRRR